MADVKLGTMADIKAAVTEDVIYRIEVSLSSRKSSVVVMRTMAKLYSLHNNGGDAEWKTLAYGVPGILLQRMTTEHNSPFVVKVIVAELETGIIQWEGEVNHDSQYQAMQTNFHSFTVNKQTFALQFVSLPEASRMLVSVRDFIRQKEETDIVNFNQSNQGKSKSKPKRKTSKKSISTPSNFKHVTRVSNQNRSNGDELGSSFTRHLSFNAGDRAKPPHASDGGPGVTGQQQHQQQQQGPPVSPSQGNPLYAEIGEHLLEEKVQTGLPLPNHQAGLPPQNPLVPLMRGSVRLPRRQEEGDNEVDEPLIERGSLRQSLPSHIKQRVRVPLFKVNFEGSHPIPGQTTTTSDQVDSSSGAPHVPHPTGNHPGPHPGPQRLDQGPMLSSQPNLATSREIGGAPQHFPVQPTQPPSLAHPTHAQKPDAGGNADLSHNSLPRPPSYNNQFGSAVPNNLRLLSAGSMSASMPSMERGFAAGPPPQLAPGQTSQQYVRQDASGMGGVTAPIHLPPTPFNPSPQLRTGASNPAGGVTAPNPPYTGPSPSFVPPPPFSHPHRTVPFASSPPTPSTPSTPAPPPSIVSSNGSRTAPPPAASTAAASSPLYDVLPPLQQPSPKPAKVISDHPPKPDVRGRPLSYVQWPAAMRNGHDSIRSADLHATDV